MTLVVEGVGSLSCGIYGYMMFSHLKRHAEIRSIAQPSGIQAHLSVPALDMGTTCGNTVKASELAMVCSLFLASTGVGPVLCCMVNMPLRRVSGNVVNDFVLGSITSAVQVYGVRLIVVLGHTRCGMVARAIQHWAKHEHKKAQETLSAASNQVRPLLLSLSEVVQVVGTARRTGCLRQASWLHVSRVSWDSMSRKHTVLHVCLVKGRGIFVDTWYLST